MSKCRLCDLRIQDCYMLCEACEEASGFSVIKKERDDLKDLLRELVEAIGDVHIELESVPYHSNNRECFCNNCELDRLLIKINAELGGKE